MKLPSFVSRSPLSSLHLALFLFLCAIYLFTYTPRINSSDGLAMFATAESVVRRDALDIEQIRWMELQQGTYGLDGLLYSRKGIGLPLGLLPLAWLGLLAPWWGPVGVSLLFNVIVTALTAVLLLAYLQRLGFNRWIGLLVALTYGLATPAWPYAKSLFSDPFSGLLLLGAAYALLKLHHARSPARWAYPFIAGLCLGWNLATRYAEVLFVPVFGLLLLYYWLAGIRPWRRGNRGQKPPISSSWPLLAAFALPILLVSLALLAYNLARYGDPLNTGYLPNETFSAVWWQGILGQLISPGRGLFLYSPILILSLWGVMLCWRRCRPEALTALSVILIHLLLYGKWFMWHGGFAWGPRFLAPTLPFWALFLAPVLDRALAKAPPEPKTQTGLWSSILHPSPSLLQIAFLGLVSLSLIPQLLGVIIDFAPFQAVLLDTGLPLFAPQTFFEPRYSPLIGAWPLVTPANLDLVWAWQGQLQPWLLFLLAANLLLAGWSLVLHLPVSAGRFRASSQVAGLALALLSNLVTAGLLLAQVHLLPPAPLQQAVATLNRLVRPGDAIITNEPEVAQDFAELYRGRAPVLGLNSGGVPLPEKITRRLHETIAGHQQIWWLPNWLPPEESAVEQTLLATCFRARSEDFDGQRLLLFACPAGLEERARPVERTFGDAIRLLSAAYLQSASAGAALPVELRWQALTPPAKDYHVFIHLLDAAGDTVVQADGQPALWTRPTSTWAAGETILDRHALWLPPGTPPGPYELRIGLYLPDTGQRLLLENGQDGVTLETVIQEERR